MLTAILRKDVYKHMLYVYERYTDIIYLCPLLYSTHLVKLGISFDSAFNAEDYPEFYAQKPELLYDPNLFIWFPPSDRASRIKVLENAIKACDQ